LYGDNGNDTLNGGAGEDKIYAGEGNDIAYGGDDNDTISGQYGNNQLYGEGGNDVITGGQDNDYVDGGIGNDTVSGGYGADTIIGGEGDDSLYGTTSLPYWAPWAVWEGDTDRLIGGTGNDLLAGAYANDIYVFNIGDGQDTIDDARPASDDNMDKYFTEQGIETIEFGAGITSADVTYSLSGTDLVIDFVSSSDQITIKYWADEQTVDTVTYSNKTRFNVKWSDGTVESLQALSAL